MTIVYEFNRYVAELTRWVKLEMSIDKEAFIRQADSQNYLSKSVEDFRRSHRKNGTRIFLL